MSDFASDLARELQRYANVVEEELTNAQEDVADIAVNKLRQNSPKKQVVIVKVGVRKK
ncbi:Prophage pi2 protein 37 [Bacillus thuringiensis serovar thuringiensis str. T01001]|nr:Prophage pi2 protein 37 [Bacillus thuringiensis serovar thuringiensis str. T01001]